MSLSGRSSIVVCFLVLAGLACAPIWTVEYFVPQDGPAHAYSASLMLRLMRADTAAAELFAFNPWTISSSLGHWVLVMLLTVVSPFVATKVMVTATYAGVVAAVVFLRFSTVGREGLLTSLLLGAAIGFNWLWLGGLYNFLFGAIGLAATLGLFFRWQDRLTAARIAALSVLLFLVYLSHIVTFGVLVAGLLLLAAFGERERRRTLVVVLVALAPVILVALVYGFGASESAPGTEPFVPSWRRLSNPWSLASWVTHLRTADPFFIISRRAVPFLTATSGMFAVFTPLLWLLLATGALTWSTLRHQNAARPRSRRHFALLALFAGCALGAAFGPDDFGTSHGTLLRERLAFLAAILFVPLYRTHAARSAARTLAHLSLAGLITFQIAALWEYARQASRDASEFLAIADGLDDQTPLASVIILENGARFPSNPMAEMGNFIGVPRHAMVWDNYQLGYSLFPVVARSPEDRRFVFDLTSINVFDEAEPAAERDARLARLAAFFEANHPRIETILLWRRNTQVEQVLGRWYETEPNLERGRARLYRRR